MPYQHLSGPDFLAALAETELNLGNDANAIEFRRRHRDWTIDQDALRRARELNAGLEREVLALRREHNTFGDDLEARARAVLGPVALHALHLANPSASWPALRIKILEAAAAAEQSPRALPFGNPSDQWLQAAAHAGGAVDDVAASIRGDSIADFEDRERAIGPAFAGVLKNAPSIWQRIGRAIARAFAQPIGG